MKQLLFWFFAFFITIPLSAQNETVFEQENLVVVLPKIEKFYKVHFSYVDTVLFDKKVSIVLDEIISIDAIVHTLDSQTNLKFEIIDAQNIVISSFSKTDRISICGQLLSNNLPVENAAINVNNIFYSSDENGNFVIKEVPYNSIVIVSSFGIEKTSFKAANYRQPDCKVIVLQEKEEKLDQVVIQDYLTGGITKNVKQTTINTKKLKVLPGLIEPDILESIHQIPGVSNISETVSSMYVRGGNADQNLIVWNNIKTYNNSHLFGTVSAFNPYVIDKVNFINKGTSAQYGDNISSVIDIQSNYKIAKKVKGGAGFNLLHADAYLNTPIIKNKFSLQVSGRRSYADAFETPTFKNYEKRIFQNTSVFDNQLEINQSRNNTWFYDYTLNATWKVNAKNQLKVNHLHSNNHLNFSAINTDESHVYIDAFDTKNSGYNFEWKKEWNSKISHQIDSYFSKYQLDYQFTDETFSGISANLKKNTIQDFGLNSIVNYDLTSERQLKFGYQFTRKTLSHVLEEKTLTSSTNLNNANSTTIGNSLFAEYQVNVPKEYLFSIGVRGNLYSDNKTIYLEPRVVLQKFVTPQFSINTSMEYKSQFLSQIEKSVVYNATLENNIWANNQAQNLPITTSYQYSFGGNYSQNNWIVDVEAYFKKIKHISSLQFNFETAQSLQFDVGNANIQGLDLFIKKQFKNYHSWFSYTLNSTHYVFDGLNDGKRFNSNINIGNTIKWSHFYKYKNIEFALGWIWRDGKPDTRVDANQDVLGNINYNFEKLNNENLPVYHRLDFSVVYDFQMKKNSEVKYRLGLSVLNLYNRKNILNKQIQYNNDQLYVNTITATQITPNLVFRVFW